MKKELVSISQRSNFEAKLPLDFSRLPKQERSLATPKSSQVCECKSMHKKEPQQLLSGLRTIIRTIRINFRTFRTRSVYFSPSLYVFHPLNISFSLGFGGLRSLKRALPRLAVCAEAPLASHVSGLPDSLTLDAIFCTAS